MKRKTISNKIKLTLGLMSNLFNIDPNLTRRFIYFTQAMREKSGIQYMIKYIKVSRLHITRYICGKPLLSNTAGVSLTRDGFPTRLMFLKEIIDSGDNVKIRGVLTLLNYSRSITPNKAELAKININYDTVTDAYGGKNYTIPTWFIRLFVEKYKLKSKIPLYTKALHYISTKGSTYGKATMTATYALYQMSKNHTSMITTFTEMLGISTYMDVMGSHLVNTYRFLGMASTRFLEHKFLGRISIVKDPELKMRVIAMLDYYSQFILRPIHKILMDKLRNFKCDRTYTQDPFHK